MAGLGGPRPNSGPKPGRQLRALSRIRAHELVQTGCAPLDTMLGNMVYWRNSAEALGRRIEEMVEECAELPANEKMDALLKIKPLLSEFIEFRKNSQSCAVEAAPYVHPRLASIQVDAKRTDTLTIINSKMTPAEAAESYSRMRQTSSEELMQQLGIVNVGSED